MTFSRTLLCWLLCVCGHPSAFPESRRQGFVALGPLGSLRFCEVVVSDILDRIKSVWVQHIKFGIDLLQTF